jgi:hypothetical protein
MKFGEKVGFFVVIIASLILAVGASVPASAQSTSTNYKVEESFFGTGGELDASSTNYKAKQSAGELTVGNAASTNYQFYGGFNTTNDPLLEFAVNGGTYDLGNIDSSITGSAVATFSIRNYLSSGYVVLVHGSPPTTVFGSSHTLSPLATSTPSQAGVEQFGINLVNNAVPDIGADPSQLPDVTYGFGAAASGYDTADLFKFVDGDTIAFSNKSSGQTNYALSIIANVDRSTPAGQYGGRLNIQVVPTF